MYYRCASVPNRRQLQSEYIHLYNIYAYTRINLSPQQILNREFQFVLIWIYSDIIFQKYRKD